MTKMLTGIQPSGDLHLGNYFGAVRPCLRHQEGPSVDLLVFLADLHALTTVHDGERLRSHSKMLARDLVALGLDRRTILFRQSDVPEVAELALLLSMGTGMGLLQRAHSYKDKVDNGITPTVGLFFYPVLMAADILLYDADVVPVGKDQQQHLELTRDVALRLNHLYGDGTVVVPKAVGVDAPLVPGLDGQKMSKSKGNAVPLFAPPKALRKTVMKMKTSSEELDEPKPAEGTLVFELYRLVASDAEVAEMKAKLEAGGYGWGHAKDDLFQAIEAAIGHRRERYQHLVDHPDELEDILQAGARRAREIARATMERVRSAIGVSGRR